MKYFIAFVMMFMLTSVACAENPPKKKDESKYVNYTQYIKSWATYNFVSEDYTFKVLSIRAYRDGYDATIKNKLKMLVIVDHDGLKLAYYLFISPERGVERHTLLGSSLFQNNEEIENPSTIEDGDKQT
jgi:hypothetical protein